MESEKSGPSTALLNFASAGDADRLVAGVAVVARAVRALADAGFASARLAVPEGQAIGHAAWQDIRRVAPEFDARAAGPGEAPGAQVIAPDSLVPTAAEVVRGTGKKGDGFVSRWINRPISQRISALLLNIPGVRPIHATIGTALLGLAMIAALLTRTPEGLIAGALLFQAASIFDGVDGEIARATYRSSRTGAALDTCIDMATNLFFILGLAINLSAREGWLALAVGGWGLAMLVIGLSAIAWRASRQAAPFTLDLVKHRYRERSAGRAVAGLIRLLTRIASRDFFALGFAVVILAGHALMALAIFSLGATIWILFVAGLALPRAAPLPDTEAKYEPN